LQRTRPHAVTAFVAAVVALWSGIAGGCSSNEGSVALVSVPADVPTITAALERARPGTIIEVGPGTYHEAVVIEVSGVTLRGVDRNDVVLDGRYELANGVTVKADGVAVENLTVRNYNQNGIVFNGIAAASGGAVDPTVDYGVDDDVLVGYRVSWVTAHNNGLYGVYAFAARGGLIEHTYVSGHPDSGLYVGQCRPCDVVIRSVVAERNAIGYYGTNASGGVYVVSSTFRRNRLGIAPNSQDVERLAPQADAVIAGNLVADNDDPDTPRIPSGYFGGGIAIGGGTRNIVVRNRIVGHDRAGIELLALDGYRPENNRIEGNVLEGNAVDLAYAVAGAADAAGNCFSGNRYRVSLPARIEEAMPCDGSARPFEVPPALTFGEPASVDFRSVPAPPAQETMPTGVQRTQAGAGPVPVIDLDTITVPR
jgi:nitrous oxidase accessory protein NosD